MRSKESLKSFRKLLSLILAKFLILQFNIHNLKAILRNYSNLGRIAFFFFFKNFFSSLNFYAKLT
jgi:DNA integrity scanning protein DisA with diadenylate cyclase activity